MHNAHPSNLETIGTVCTSFHRIRNRKHTKRNLNSILITYIAIFKYIDLFLNLFLYTYPYVLYGGRDSNLSYSE